MEEEKLHTQEFQLKDISRNIRCKLLQKRSTGKTTECSKHLWLSPLTQQNYPPHQNKNPQQRLIPPTTKLEGGKCPDYPNNRHTTSQSHFSVPQVNAQVYLSTCSTGLLWSKFHNVFRTFNMELDPNCFERHWTFCWI